MKVVALLSGGKDSCYALLQCLRAGHDVVAVATLLPPTSTVDDIDSHCFQTIGHQLLPSIATCLRLPFYSRPLTGHSLVTSLHYEPHPDDEVEDLLALLSTVRAAHPDLTAVCSGAILSNYQRLRVEHCASVLGLTSLAPLWQRSQRPLLQEMIDADMGAILIKVASMGLDASFINRPLADVAPRLSVLGDQFGLNECGEGGEYESLVLDCPLFREQRIVLEESEVVTEGGAFAQVSLLRVKRWTLQAKEVPPPVIDVAPAPAPRVKRWVAVETPVSAVPEPWGGSSPLSALFPLIRVAGDLAFVSNASTSSSAADPSASSHSAQLAGVLSSHLALLQSKGFTPSHIVSLLLALPSMSSFATLNATYAEHLPAKSPPSRTTIQLPSSTVQADLVACSTARATSSLHVQSVSPWAPACIGPYSQSVSCYYLLCQAGQIGLVPWSMTMDSGGVAAEVQRVKDNCEAVLGAVKGGWNHCFLTTVWLATNDEEVRAEVVARYRCKGPVLWLYAPALPRDAAVEVQQLAYRPAANFTVFHTSPRSRSRPPRLFDIHYQAALSEESTLSLLLTVLPSGLMRTVDAVGVEEVQQTMEMAMEAVKEQLKEAAMRVERVLMVRCYVLVGVDLGVVERALYEAWKRLVSSEADLPAVSFFPVLGIAVDDGQSKGVLSLHCLFCRTELMP